MSPNAFTVELEKRLRSLDAERDHLQKRLTHLQEKEGALRLLLEEENDSSTPVHPSGHPIKPRGTNGDRPFADTPLARVIIEHRNDAQLGSLDELAQWIRDAGVVPAGRNAKRSAHFTMLSWRNAGYAEMTSAGQWKLTEKALARIADQSGDKGRQQALMTVPTK